MSDTIICNNTFSAMDVRSVFINSLHIHEQPIISYFAALLQTLYYYSKVHVVGFLSHFEQQTPSKCEINRRVAEYRTEELRSAVVPYIALKEVAHGMVCLSEPHRGLHFRDVICARRYCEKPFVG